MYTNIDLSSTSYSFISQQKILGDNSVPETVLQTTHT